MIVETFRAGVDKVLADRLAKAEQRELVVAAVMEGFGRLRKNAGPDLPDRIKDIEKRVRHMAEEVAVGFVNGRLVLKVAGSSDSLMKELRRGTDWYEPWEKVDETVLAASLVDPPK